MASIKVSRKRVCVCGGGGGGEVGKVVLRHNHGIAFEE